VTARAEAEDENPAPPPRNRHVLDGRGRPPPAGIRERSLALDPASHNPRSVCSRTSRCSSISSREYSPSSSS
jgi:CxxC motif-containing protein (DUF1111 family)